MFNKKIAVVIGITLFLACRPAFAYIDPGTGMSFVSGLGAFILGFFTLAFGAIVLTFKKWTHAIKTWIAKFKKAKPS